MEEIKIGSKKPKKVSLGKQFLRGFFIALIIGGVFFAGLQIGSGRWSLSFSQSAIKSNQDLPNKLDYSSVTEVYNKLKQKFDGPLDEAALINGMKKGMVDAAGDPYTTYLDKEEAAEFDSQLNGTFEGIGAVLAKDGDYVIVETPLSGYPAEKAGLKARDIIIKIDDQDATGLSTAEAVKRIRGEKGTNVKLNVVRNGEPLEFNVVRETISIPSVETSYAQNDTIGVIKINSFGTDTVALVEKTITEFKLKNVKGIVVDLRNNPGGYLDGAVKVSGNWLKKGQVIVEEKRDDKVVESFKATKDGTLLGVPTVVLINEGSASASEIMAGALRDNGAATLVGVTTYGKGSVQEVVQFDDGGALKVTVARWYTPSGKNINKDGIAPDQKIELTEENFKNKQDPQFDAAIQKLTSQP